MSPEEIRVELDKLITRQEAQLIQAEGFLRRLRDLRDGVEHAPVEMTASPPEDTKTNYQQVVAFLKAHGNRGQTSKAIASGTGLSASVLSQVLYRTHRDSFISTLAPGMSRKRLWQLSEAALWEAEGGQAQGLLFGVEGGDLAGVKAVECCYRVLVGHGNEPMSVLTITREALGRGYKGRAVGPPDEVLMTTAKGFWARLGRDKRFVEVRPLVFALKGLGQPDPLEPPGAMEDGE